MSDLGNVLSRKPLIKKADTRSMADRAKDNGISFSEQFEREVKNMQYYPIPKEMKLRNILKRKLSAGWQRLVQLLGF